MIIVLSFLSISCTRETSYVIQNDFLMFSTSFNTTEQDIEYAAAEFKKADVDIIIDRNHSKFKEDGKIKVLKLKIAYNEISGDKFKRDTLTFRVKRMGLIFRNYGFKIKHDFEHGATFASVGPIN